MTARFLELIREHQARAAEMVVHKDVLRRGPFWPSCLGPQRHCVKNRFNNVVISNVTEEHAGELAQLLTELEKT